MTIAMSRHYALLGLPVSRLALSTTLTTSAAVGGHHYNCLCPKHAGSTKLPLRHQAITITIAIRTTTIQTMTVLMYESLIHPPADSQSVSQPAAAAASYPASQPVTRPDSQAVWWWPIHPRGSNTWLLLRASSAGVPSLLHCAFHHAWNSFLPTSSEAYTPSSKAQLRQTYHEVHSGHGSTPLCGDSPEYS